MRLGRTSWTSGRGRSRSTFTERSYTATGTGPFPTPLVPFDFSSGPFSDCELSLRLRCGYNSLMNWRTMAAIAVVIATAPQLAFAEPVACKASLAQYKKLRFGMSYEQVEAIIGCPGRPMPKSPFGPFTTYHWDGYSKRVMCAGFRDGHGMFHKCGNLGRHGVWRRQPGLLPSIFVRRDSSLMTPP